MQTKSSTTNKKGNQKMKKLVLLLIGALMSCNVFASWYVGTLWSNSSRDKVSIPFTTHSLRCEFRRRLKADGTVIPIQITTNGFTFTVDGKTNDASTSGHYHVTTYGISACAGEAYDVFTFRLSPTSPKVNQPILTIQNMSNTYKSILGYCCLQAIN